MYYSWHFLLGISRALLLGVTPEAFSNQTQRSHVAGRPYSCNYCEKTFKKSSHAKDHERQKHTGEKPYPCDYCEKRFTKSSEATQHERIHTGYSLSEALILASFNSKYDDRLLVELRV